MLPSLWADLGPGRRRALVGRDLRPARCPGVRALEYQLTLDTIDSGLDAALPPILELGGQIGEFGRGERSRPRGTVVIDWQTRRPALDPSSTAPDAFDLDGLPRVVFRSSRYFVIAMR